MLSCAALLARDLTVADLAKPVVSSVQTQPVPADLNALGSDDMHDTPGDLAAADPVLRLALGECAAIEKVYDEADQAAGLHQKAYQRRAKWAAWLGVVALLSAIATLGLEHASLSIDRPGGIPWLEWVIRILVVAESVAAVLVAVIVLRGRMDDSKENWLLQRHRAERCRLLKFHFLTHPFLWSGRDSDVQKWKGSLDAELHEVDTLSYDELNVWLWEDMPPDVRGPYLGQWPNPQARDALVAYYRRKRLNNQRDYFARKAKQHSQSDRSTKPWLHWLFFGSVVAVLIHLLLDGMAYYLVRQGEDDAAHVVALWSVLFVCLAAALPTIGAGVRTYRTAHEFARNTSRFQAKHHALCELTRRLSEVLSEAPDNTAGVAPDREHDTHAVLRELGFCEHILESDHREWLRLMAEAEWYG